MPNRYNVLNSDGNVDAIKSPPPLDKVLQRVEKELAPRMEHDFMRKINGMRRLPTQYRVVKNDHFGSSTFKGHKFSKCAPHKKFLYILAFDRSITLPKDVWYYQIYEDDHDCTTLEMYDGNDFKIVEYKVGYERLNNYCTEQSKEEIEMTAIAPNTLELMIENYGVLCVTLNEGALDRFGLLPNQKVTIVVQPKVALRYAYQMDSNLNSLFDLPPMTRFVIHDSA